MVFRFHWELYWALSPFFSTTFYLFSGNFIVPSSLIFFFLIFLSKELFQGPFIVFQGIEFFFFIKRILKRSSKDAVSEYSRPIRASQPSYNSFCLVIKETRVLFYRDGRWFIFLLSNSRCFSLNTAFSWSNQN